MKRTMTLAVLLVAAALTVNSGHAQSAKPGVEKLYILNCGEGVAGDISRWYADPRKIKGLGFTPHVDLNSGLRKTIQWLLG